MASNYPTDRAATQGEGGTLPGLRLRLSQNGLDYAAQVAIDQLCAKLQGHPITDQHGTDRVSGGKVEYHIRNTTIQNFVKPASRVVVSPASGVTWTATGASIAVHGDWKYKYRWHFVKGSDDGSFSVSASGVDFSISIKLGVDGEGRPTISSSSCSSHVSKLKVKFNGGASWLYNIFDGQISRALKGKLEDVILSAAKKLIDVDAAKKLSELNTFSNIGTDLTLDYRLVCPPIFHEGYMDIMHKGEVARKTNPEPLPFVPDLLPVDADSTKMIYIWASEFVINSYAYTAFSNGLLKHKLKQKDMPDGNILSPAEGTSANNENQPNFVEVELEATAPPQVRIQPEGIGLTFTGDLTLRGHTPQTQLDYVFKVATVLSMNVNVRVEDETLKADVSDFKSEFKVLESQLGHMTLPDNMLTWIFGNIVNKFIHPHLKGLGDKGFSLPNIKGCNYTNHTIQLNQGNLLIATDVTWTAEDS